MRSARALRHRVLSLVVLAALLHAAVAAAADIVVMTSAFHRPTCSG
jgi:hypothetical protein